MIIIDQNVCMCVCVSFWEFFFFWHWNFKHFFFFSGKNNQWWWWWFLLFIFFLEKKNDKDTQWPMIMIMMHFFSLSEWHPNLNLGSFFHFSFVCLIDYKWRWIIFLFLAHFAALVVRFFFNSIYPFFWWWCWLILANDDSKWSFGWMVDIVNVGFFSHAKKKIQIQPGWVGVYQFFFALVS